MIAAMHTDVGLTFDTCFRPLVKSQESPPNAQTQCPKLMHKNNILSDKDEDNDEHPSSKMLMNSGTRVLASARCTLKGLYGPGADRTSTIVLELAARALRPRRNVAY